jgi:hypothetical protein
MLVEHNQMDCYFFIGLFVQSKGCFWGSNSERPGSELVLIFSSKIMRCMIMVEYCIIFHGSPVS